MELPATSPKAAKNTQQLHLKTQKYVPYRPRLRLKSPTSSQQYQTTRAQNVGRLSLIDVSQEPQNRESNLPPDNIDTDRLSRYFENVTTTSECTNRDPTLRRSRPAALQQEKCRSAQSCALDVPNGHILGPMELTSIQEMEFRTAPNSKNEFTHNGVIQTPRKERTTGPQRGTVPFLEGGITRTPSCLVPGSRQQSGKDLQTLRAYESPAMNSSEWLLPEVGCWELQDQDIGRPEDIACTSVKASPAPSRPQNPSPAPANIPHHVEEMSTTPSLPFQDDVERRTNLEMGTPTPLGPLMPGPFEVQQNRSTPGRTYDAIRGTSLRLKTTPVQRPKPRRTSLREIPSSQYVGIPLEVIMRSMNLESNGRIDAIEECKQD